MKTLALLLFILPIISIAQNGGQYSQNGVGKLQYIGYSSGHYLVEVTNLQTCSVDRKITWLNKDTTINIAANTAIIVQLPGNASGNTLIKSKPLDACTPGADMGWLEVSSPLSLPITFKSIRAESLSNNRVKVTFEVADVSGTNTYHIQLSKDGKNYIDKAIYFSSDTKANATYSVIIQL